MEAPAPVAVFEASNGAELDLIESLSDVAWEGVGWRRGHVDRHLLGSFPRT